MLSLQVRHPLSRYDAALLFDHLGTRSFAEYCGVQQSRVGHLVVFDEADRLHRYTQLKTSPTAVVLRQGTCSSPLPEFCVLHRALSPGNKRISTISAGATNTNWHDSQLLVTPARNRGRRAGGTAQFKVIAFARTPLLAGLYTLHRPLVYALYSQCVLRRWQTRAGMRRQARSS